MVVGMPNVGKSTLLNTLRHVGIKGRAYTIYSSSKRRSNIACRHIKGPEDVCQSRAHESTVNQAETLRSTVNICL